MRYFAFGLRLSSEHSIPGLEPAEYDGEPDLCIWIGRPPEIARPQDIFFREQVAQSDETSERRVYRLSASGLIHFRYADETEFFIDNSATQIWTTWVAPYTVEDMATYLLGPILGFVMRMRNLVALHASSCVTGGRALALVGGAGAGKSTTAAAFAARGCAVLADDVTSLDEAGNRFLVRPSYPRLRLWPESAELICGSRDALPPITPNWDKRDFNLLDRGCFQPQPVPLGAIYLFGDRVCQDRAPCVESIEGPDRLMALIANTYGNTLLDAPMRAHEFDILGRLVTAVPVRRIVPHSSPERLGRLCDVIREDFERILTTT